MERIQTPERYGELRVFRATSIDDILRSRRTTIQSCIEFTVARKVVTDDEAISMADFEGVCDGHKIEAPYQVGNRNFHHYSIGNVIIDVPIDHLPELNTPGLEDRMTVYDRDHRGKGFQVFLPTGPDLQELQQTQPHFDPAALKRNGWESPVSLKVIYSCKGDNFTLMYAANPLAFRT